VTGMADGLAGGLNKPGTFVSARFRWITTPPSDQHKLYVLAGGTTGGFFLQNGFGFKAEGSTLKGFTVSGGIPNPVTLNLGSPPLPALSINTWVDLLAVRRGASIDFYVDGVLRGSTASTLPTTAGSTYEVRVENGTSGTVAGYQMGFLTVGISMFP